MDSINEAEFASTMIGLCKHRLGIDKPNNEMTDDDIAKVMRTIGSFAPDSILVNEKPVYGRQGIGVMLSLTLYEFPEFYVRYELWQRN